MGTPPRPSTTTDYFEHALATIQKPQKPERLLKALLLIRSEVEGSDRKQNVPKIRSHGCLKHLAAALSDSNGKIVNTTLSILGYCCLDGKCSTELVQRYGMLPALHHVLKEYKHDSVQGRTYKLIGNLCQHRDRLAYNVVTKEPYIIKKIVGTLKNAASDEESTISGSPTSPATILVGIRALREMALKATVEKLIDFGALEAIGLLLIKFVPIWEQKRTHRDILDGVLAFLLVYSKYRCNNLISSLRETSKGNAMGYLGRLALLAPYQVVAIMRNFDDVRTSVSDLPIKEVGQSLIDVIKIPMDVDESLYRNHLKCVCFLLHNPANKDALKSIGIIKVLLDVLSMCTSTYMGIRNCILVLGTLRTYLMDAASISEMLNGGILHVFIEKLEWLLGPTKEDDLELKHPCKGAPVGRTRKRRRASPSAQVLDYTTYAFAASRINQDGNQSPLSVISYTSDISLTPPSSPLSYSQLSAGEQSDSDDYSPVCSDAEEDLNGAHPPNDNMEIEISPYYDEKLSVEANDVASSASSLFDMKLELAKHVIELAKLISYADGFRDEFLHPKFLIALVKFLQLELESEWIESVRRLLSNITRQPQCLIRLMETNFFFVLHSLIKRKPQVRCAVCRLLQTVAERTLCDVVVYAKESGEGDIAYKLLRDDSNLKKRFVSCIPIIIQHKPILKKLMTLCGALDILLQSFRDLDTRSVLSLCILAQKLNVKNPVVLQHHIHQVFFETGEHKPGLNCSQTVTFVLDDGAQVRADRAFLCARSTYFDRLLAGKFKEADEETVRLRSVTQRALNVLLQLMEMKFDVFAIYNFHVEFGTLLEVITLTDQYLIEDLSPFLIAAIQYFKMNGATVPEIYRWSVASGTNILRVEAVAYCLVAEMRMNARLQMFKTISGYGCGECITEDVRSMLTRFFDVRD